jgi:formylglycine-generating enzyme
MGRQANQLGTLCILAFAASSACAQIVGDFDLEDTGSTNAPPMTTLIPGGTFNFLDEWTQQSIAMNISHAFYLDTLEVSVDRFKVWVDRGKKLPCATGKCSLDPGGPYDQTMRWDAAWNTMAESDSYATGCNNAGATNINTPTYTNSSGGDLPMNCLDWYHAAAFCFSEGKRLPTETEWQYAATGRGRLNHLYPWGDPDPTDCTLAIWNNDGDNDNGSHRCTFPMPGGSAPLGASHDGLLDMAGSVFEWTWDYSRDYPTAAQTDYAGPIGGNQRTDRGGSWARPMEYMRTTYRDAMPAETAYADFGVRCAKTKLP